MFKICAVAERYIDGNEVYLFSMQLKTIFRLIVRISFFSFFVLAFKLFNLRFRRHTYMPLVQFAPKPGNKYLAIRNVCHLSMQILPKHC
jgi:hypothetical protein